MESTPPENPAPTAPFGAGNAPSPFGAPAFGAGGSTGFGSSASASPFGAAALGSSQPATFGIQTETMMEASGQGASPAYGSAAAFRGGGASTDGGVGGATSGVGVGGAKRGGMEVGGRMGAGGRGGRVRGLSPTPDTTTTIKQGADAEGMNEEGDDAVEQARRKARMARFQKPDSNSEPERPHAGMRGRSKSPGAPISGMPTDFIPPVAARQPSPVFMRVAADGDEGMMMEGEGEDGGDPSFNIVGTCDDMCPESERVRRAEAAELHPFERVGGDYKVCVGCCGVCVGWVGATPGCPQPASCPAL